MVAREDVADPESIRECAKRMCPNLTVDNFQPIISTRASHVIADFDEKTNLQSKQYKFGILYQKANQFTEEDIFQNNNPSPEFEKFLGILGDTISLEGHSGYSGGLDTKQFLISSLKISNKESLCNLLADFQFKYLNE